MVTISGLCIVTPRVKILRMIAPVRQVCAVTRKHSVCHGNNQVSDSVGGSVRVEANGPDRRWVL